MLIKEKYITLKDGRQALLRTPTADDANAMIEYLEKISCETDFLLRSSEDPLPSLVDEQRFLEAQICSKTKCMIACFVDGNHVGNCSISFNTERKLMHRASIGIAVIKEFWGLGIGTAMFGEMERIAREYGASQLELEFVENNIRARALYEKCGFRIVGIHPDACICEDGSMVNEYLMIKKI